MSAAPSRRSARPHGLAADLPLEQDPDVLDTWFSSALWPFSTLGWPEQTERLRDFYPTSVLVTGFDIIFFWVARMIMMGLKFMGDVPFRDVYIHGLVRDAHGDKMSKSKGNVLDPIDLIDGIELDALVEKRTKGMMQPHLAEKIAKQTRKDFPDGIPGFGTDALRFTFAALATTGRDVKFDLGRIEGYRNFCNKLWNASRYVLMNTEGQDCGLGPLRPRSNCRAADRWIRARLQATINTVREALDGYRFDLAAQAIYDFTWNEFCDWYLELCKPVLTGADASRGRPPRHPPHPGHDPGDPAAPGPPDHALHHRGDLAEGRAARGRAGETIMLAPYPAAEAALTGGDREVVAEIDWVRQFILGVRRIKGEMNIPPGKPLPVLIANASDQDRRWLATARPYLDFLARTESITVLDGRVAGPRVRHGPGRRDEGPDPHGRADRQGRRAEAPGQGDRAPARRRGPHPGQARQPGLRRQGPGGGGAQGARQARRARRRHRQPERPAGADRGALMRGK